MVGMEQLRGERARLMERLTTLEWLEALIDRGDMERDAYLNYLVCASRYAEQSPVVMAHAGARCINSHPEIGAYLLHHAEEERGHYLWAREDLRDLGCTDADATKRWPQTNCAAMIGVMHHCATVANPVGLLGWMYLLEAVGEDLGAAAADGLVRWLDGSPAIRFVASHAVTDVGHAQEMDEVIEAHVVAPQDWESILEVAAVVADLYVGMFDEAHRRAVGEWP